MPPAKRPRLRHVPVRLRVSVDPKVWKEMHAPNDIAEQVRRYVVEVVQASSPAIVDVRRNGL